VKHISNPFSEGYRLLKTKTGVINCELHHSAQRYQGRCMH